MEFRLPIDDFGTGHSSLTSLKRFPIDTIKIDRAFVKDLGSESEHEAIAIAIIAMTPRAQAPRSCGRCPNPTPNWICCTAQGYFFSQPLPCDLFEQLIRSHRSKPRPSEPPPHFLPLAS
jgi:EAL domain-containing protein (putative c-di-GMP-specific phosphodiesterase class I)